jgi:hypothetical protein
MRNPHSPQCKRPYNAELNSDCENLIVGINRDRVINKTLDVDHSLLL